jgi:hypothetical protein
VAVSYSKSSRVLLQHIAAGGTSCPKEAIRKGVNFDMLYVKDLKLKDT